MVPTGADTVAFLSAHDRYLCANPQGGLEWDRTAVGPWETFHIAYVGPNRVTLRTAHNKFVCAEQHGAATANRDAPQEWETFEILFL